MQQIWKMGQDAPSHSASEKPETAAEDEGVDDDKEELPEETVACTYDTSEKDGRFVPVWREVSGKCDSH